VARGDLSRKITVDVKGEILELKDTLNTMVDQLRSFASEVTASPAKWARTANSAARRKCRVWEVRGKILTDSVNSMASNLNRAGSKHRRSRDCYRER